MLLLRFSLNWGSVYAYEIRRFSYTRFIHKFNRIPSVAILSCFLVFLFVFCLFHFSIELSYFPILCMRAATLWIWMGNSTNNIFSHIVDETTTNATNNSHPSTVYTVGLFVGLSGCCTLIRVSLSLRDSFSTIREFAVRWENVFAFDAWKLVEPKIETQAKNSKSTFFSRLRHSHTRVHRLCENENKSCCRRLIEFARPKSLCATSRDFN